MVGIMHDEAAIAEEGSSTWLSRQIEVPVSGTEAVRKVGRGYDGSMFAAQVAQLTGVTVVGVTGTIFTTIEGVEVATGSRAIAISRYWVGVDVVG